MGSFTLTRACGGDVVRMGGLCLLRVGVKSHNISYACPVCRSPNEFNIRHTKKYLRTFIKTSGSCRHVFRNAVEGGPSLVCEAVWPYGDIIFSLGS
jgi:hypothetical protein